MKPDLRKGARRTTRDDPPAARRRVVYAPVTFSEVDGVRYLHFGTEWIQGAMRLRKPDAIELEYAQQMMAWSLFIEQPTAITQLGLGAAALTRFCHRNYPDAMVTAVELNPMVVVAARTMFDLPPDDATLEVLVGDAADYVDQPSRRGTLDALQVDLYDATARGPVLDSVAFYSGCRACLKSPGVMTVNLFGVHASFGRNMRAMQAAFDGRVIALPDVHDGNRIAIAFNGPPLNVRWTAMRARAAVLAKGLKLPASTWVDGLRSESRDGEAGAFRI